MDVYIKEGRVYGLLKNRKILKLTLDNQNFCSASFSSFTRNLQNVMINDRGILAGSSDG